MRRGIDSGLARAFDDYGIDGLISEATDNYFPLARDWTDQRSGFERSHVEPVAERLDRALVCEVAEALFVSFSPDPHGLIRGRVVIEIEGRAFAASQAEAVLEHYHGRIPRAGGRAIAGAGIKHGGKLIG